MSSPKLRTGWRSSRCATTPEPLWRRRCTGSTRTSTPASTSFASWHQRRSGNRCRSRLRRAKKKRRRRSSRPRFRTMSGRWPRLRARKSIADGVVTLNGEKLIAPRRTTMLALAAAAAHHGDASGAWLGLDLPRPKARQRSALHRRRSRRAGRRTYDGPRVARGRSRSAEDDLSAARSRGRRDDGGAGRRRGRPLALDRAW